MITAESAGFVLVFTLIAVGLLSMNGTVSQQFVEYAEQLREDAWHRSQVRHESVGDIENDIPTTKASATKKATSAAAPKSSVKISVQDQSNVCVLSFMTTGMYNDYGAKLKRNKEKYCEKLGYTCILNDQVIKEDGRHLVWQKVYSILQTFNTTCSKTLWIDADAIFMDYLPVPEPVKDLVLSRRCFKRDEDKKEYINAGVILYKNSEWIKHFFEDVAATSKWNNHMWQEQEAMHQLIRQNHSGAKQHLQEMDHKFLNFGKPKDGSAKQARYIYHPAGCGVKKNCEQRWEEAFKFSQVAF